MGKGLTFSITKTPETTATLALAKEWVTRADAARAQLAYLLADELQKYITSKLPSGAGYKAYRSSVNVAKVKGTAGKYDAYVVQLDMRSPWVKKVKPKQVLITIKAKKRARSTPPEVAILEKHNPWTYETLPFTPDRSVAEIKTTKAKPKAVADATKARKSDRAIWVRELKEVGVRPKRPSFSIPKGTVLPDIALDAVGLEFGVTGGKSRPVWKLGLIHLSRNVLPRLVKNRKLFVLPLSQFSNKLWKKWPTRAKTSVSIAQTKMFSGFSKKLGTR